MKQSFIGFGSSKPSKLKFRHVFYSVVGFFCGFIAVRASGLIPSFVVGVGGAGIGSLFGHLWHGYFDRYIETEFAKLESKLIGDELVGGMDGNPPTYDAKLELNTPRIHMAMVSVIECSAITTALILAFENLYFSDLELFSSYTRDAIGLLLFITEPFPDLSRIFVGQAERIRHPELRQVTILITLWGGVSAIIL